MSLNTLLIICVGPLGLSSRTRIGRLGLRPAITITSRAIYSILSCSLRGPRAVVELGRSRRIRDSSKSLDPVKRGHKMSSPFSGHFVNSSKEA